MEILANNYKFDKNNSNPPTRESFASQDLFEKLIGFITLTEEDRLKAGIYVGKEGQDWIDRSALTLPSLSIEE